MFTYLPRFIFEITCNHCPQGALNLTLVKCKGCKLTVPFFYADYNFFKILVKCKVI